MDFLLQIWKNIKDGAPQVLGALAILIGGWIFARILRKVFKKLFEKIGIDKLAEKLNDIDIVANSNVKFVPSIFLSSLIYYLIIFVVIMISVDVLQMDAISDLLVNFMNYLPKVFSALVVLIVGVLFADAIKKMVLTAAESLAIPAAKMISNIIFYFLFINIALIALKQAEMQTEFIETNISIILAGIVFAFALGYGLASQGVMGSLLSSFYKKDIINEGDEVIIDGVQGKVVEKSNSVVTIDTGKSKVIIPLNKLLTDKIEILNK